MQRTDQTSLVSPQEHILPQGKKGSESVARQYFCISSFVIHVCATYENDEETSVIKSLWKKAYKKRKNEERSKFTSSLGMEGLFFYLHQQCTHLVNRRSFHSLVISC
jgi:hypothetical protein